MVSSRMNDLCILPWYVNTVDQQSLSLGVTKTLFWCRIISGLICIRCSLKRSTLVG